MRERRAVGVALGKRRWFAAAESEARCGRTISVPEFLGAWKDFRAEVEEYRELGDERVLVLIRFSGRGKTSGLELDQMRAKGATLYCVRAAR